MSPISLLKNRDWLRVKTKIDWNDAQSEVAVPVFQISLLKNGDWLRVKTKIDWNDARSEVPVPVFQQTDMV